MMSSAKMTPLEKSASFSSPSRNKSNGSMEKPSTRSSPTEKSSFTAVVKVSKMQASFAERTATEMEEIVSWYQKYEGIERLKKENQQIQSMPHNAMIVVGNDDGGEDNDDNDVEKENEDRNNIDLQDNEQHEIQIGDEEFVTVKDYHTPNRKLAKQTASHQKNATSLLASAVRSISKARKTDDPPPIAMKISSEDEDESIISSPSPKHIDDDSIKRIDQQSAGTVSGDLMCENPNEEGNIEYRDAEEEVLAMLSPTGCAQLKAQTLIENKDDYVDEEEEVLELLLSPSSTSRGKRILTFGGARKSPLSHSDDSGSRINTGQEAQNQIKAADDVIRNTQDMAEIIFQLQQSSLVFGNENGDDNVNTNDDIACSDDISSPISSASFSSIQHGSDIIQRLGAQTGTRVRFSREMGDRDGSSHYSASVALLKVTGPVATENNFSGFQGRLFYRAIVPILLSLVIGLILKLINA